MKMNSDRAKAMEKKGKETLRGKQREKDLGTSSLGCFVLSQAETHSFPFRSFDNFSISSMLRRIVRRIWSFSFLGNVHLLSNESIRSHRMPYAR